jgi:hypothetical protein
VATAPVGHGDSVGQVLGGRSSLMRHVDGEATWRRQSDGVPAPVMALVGGGDDGEIL